MELQFDQEVKTLPNSGARLVASRGEKPRARVLRAEGIAIVAKRFKCIRLDGEEGRNFSDKAMMQRGAMHVSIFVDIDLGGQDIQWKKPATVLSTHSEFRSCPVVLKVSSHVHGLVMA